MIHFLDPHPSAPLPAGALRTLPARSRRAYEGFHQALASQVREGPGLFSDSVALLGVPCEGCARPTWSTELDGPLSQILAVGPLGLDDEHLRLVWAYALEERQLRDRHLKNLGGVDQQPSAGLSTEDGAGAVPDAAAQAFAESVESAQDPSVRLHAWVGWLTHLQRAEGDALSDAAFRAITEFPEQPYAALMHYLAASPYLHASNPRMRRFALQEVDAALRAGDPGLVRELRYLRAWLRFSLGDREGLLEEVAGELAAVHRADPAAAEASPLWRDLVSLAAMLVEASRASALEELPPAVRAAVHVAVAERALSPEVAAVAWAAAEAAAPLDSRAPDWQLRLVDALAGSGRSTEAEAEMNQRFERFGPSSEWFRSQPSLDERFLSELRRSLERPLPKDARSDQDRWRAALGTAVRGCAEEVVAARPGDLAPWYVQVDARAARGRVVVSKVGSDRPLPEGFRECLLAAPLPGGSPPDGTAVGVWRVNPGAAPVADGVAPPAGFHLHTLVPGAVDRRP